MPLDQTIIDRTLSTPHGEQGYRVVETLLDAGYEAWWVGGCVREMFLDQIPDDIDIATNALPQDVQKLFPKYNPDGERFGSIIVSLGGSTFEVTTFREDDEASDGRHPESVSFTKKKEDDAARRDITVNAMYWNPVSSELFDPFEGEKDLNERLVRIIGDPDERIAHDALRLLRIVRFRAAIDGGYHPDTFAILHKRAKDIEILSGSRRFAELEKMLLGPHPEIAFEDLWEMDILEYLLPELHACKGVAQPAIYHNEGDVWNHMIKLVGSFTGDHGADVRLAGLFHDIGKPQTFEIRDDRIHFDGHATKGAEMSKKILDRLQCPSVRRDKICWLVDHHMMMGTFEGMPEVRKTHWYYHPWFTELLQVMWLDIAGCDPSNYDLYESIIADYNAFLDAHPRPKKPLIDGNEVMEIFGLQPGEKVGEILKQLHEAQVNGEIENKEEARVFLKRMT
jgi:putative nucleotidyltransferase with HDIG domain